MRVRLAVRSRSRELIARAVRKFEALYTGGPAGGGGMCTRVDLLMNSISVYVDRDVVEPRARLLESRNAA